MYSLLGKQLKDDGIAELLEAHDVDVVYDFDRLHENIPDTYWASIYDAGIQLRFNEHQTLSTLFCYIIPHYGFDTVAIETLGVPACNSFQIAEQACQVSKLPYVASPTKLWLKVIGDSHHTHYEFKEGALSMITFMLPNEVEV